MVSIKYHAIFDYELIKSDFPKWLYKGEKTPLRSKSFAGQARINREKISEKKFLIAKKAARILFKIPTIKFVGVTGSLAMMNANENSDIDLMIITSRGTLWLSRLVILVLLVILLVETTVSTRLFQVPHSGHFPIQPVDSYPHC